VETGNLAIVSGPLQSNQQCQQFLTKLINLIFRFTSLLKLQATRAVHRCTRGKSQRHLDYRLSRKSKRLAFRRWMFLAPWTSLSILTPHCLHLNA